MKAIRVGCNPMSNENEFVEIDVEVRQLGLVVTP
jgi:hypothetical protein